MTVMMTAVNSAELMATEIKVSVMDQS